MKDDAKAGQVGHDFVEKDRYQKQRLRGYSNIPDRETEGTEDRMRVHIVGTLVVSTVAVHD